MVGRTNINHITITSGSIGGGVSNTVDLPTHLKSLSTVSSNSKITLNFEYSDTTFLSGVEVRYKTGSYPESPTDGQGITVEGSPASVAIENLTNGIVYYFRIFLFNTVDGTNYYQTDMTNARIFNNPYFVGISGITPAIVGENYLVIDQSGTFSLNVPEGITLTTYLVGGGNKGDTGCRYLDNDNYYYFRGGYGGYGGYVYSFTMSNISSTDVFTVTIGTASKDGSYSTTTIKNSNSTIDESSKSGSRKQGGRNAEQAHDGFDYSPPGSGLSGIYTPYGYVGSSGGGGGTQCMSGESGGAGAGDGGGPNHENGYPATNYGCGGGGAYYFSTYTYNVGGDGKQGCIIITWGL